MEWTFILVALIISLIIFAVNYGTIVSPSSHQLKNKFEGKTILLTGGASGIGKELCIQLASLHSKVFVLDNHSDLLDLLREDIKSLGLGDYVNTVLSDVSDRERLYRDVEKIAEKLEDNAFDFVICNAGIVFGKRLEELKDEHIEKTISVNLLSNFWMTKAVLPAMKKRGRGHLVFVSSVAGIVGMTNMTDYCASKFGSFGFAESLRRELWNDHPGIRVSTVCPWAISTGMFSGMGRVVLPPLNPSHTARCIINGMCRGCRLIPIPWYMRFLSVMRFMPESVSDCIGYFSNAMSASQTIKGRGADWNMVKLKE